MTNITAEQYRKMVKPKSKYKNVKCTVTDLEGKDIKYDSLKEMRRHQELLLLQKRGEITELDRQISIELIPVQYEGGKCVERACNYIADFTYYRDGVFIVEDSKGYRTPDYKIKKKLLLHVFGFKILET